jgi:aerobic carbon-monoxide dehydrogenase large subunit
MHQHFAFANRDDPPCNTSMLASHPFEPLRREDPRLITGAGCYVHDVSLAGMLHVAFVRSPSAHGQSRSLRYEGADEITFLTREQLGEHWMPAINELLPLAEPQRFALLGGPQISYVGQPLALVVATSRDAARLAVEQVRIEIDAQPAVLDFSVEAPASVRVKFGTQEIHASAAGDVEVSACIKSPRVIAMSMEPRAVVAQWNESPAGLKLWLPTQTPSRARSDVAACLGLQEAQVQVIAPDVGGAFGAKASVSPEDLLVALAAQYLKTAVSWQASRSEEFTSGMHGRGSVLSGCLRVNAQGMCTALDAQLEFALGAWLPFSGVMPLRNAARILPGPYRVPQINIQGQAKRSHATPLNIYRGAGRPEAALLMETLIDKAACALEMDPVALRRINVVAPIEQPYSTPTGELFDSGNYAQALDLACEKFGYAQERAEQKLRRQHGEHVGIGVALYVEPCGQGWEAARVSLQADGQITVASGSPAQGQGHETTYAEIAWRELSPHLNCSLGDIQVVYGDTDLCPLGIGTLASRSTAIGGSAIVLACRKLIEMKQALAPQQIVFPLVAEAKFTAKESWSYGCVIVRMKVDADTGKPTIERMVWADDAGIIISPKLAKGQLIGGMAQGLGQAIMEQIMYDEAGQLLTGSLMDYAIPRADDMPDAIEIESFATPSPHNLLGAKGVGEAGCIGVPAAVMNAARDASQLPPETDLDFPLTAEKLWRAMHQHS